MLYFFLFFFFFQAEDGIRDLYVTGVQTCALPISRAGSRPAHPDRSRARMGGVDRRGDSWRGLLDHARHRDTRWVPGARRARRARRAARLKDRGAARCGTLRRRRTMTGITRFDVLIHAPLYAALRGLAPEIRARFRRLVDRLRAGHWS